MSPAIARPAASSWSASTTSDTRPNASARSAVIMRPVIISSAATLLPTAELCTRSPFPSARRLLDAGATVALASDCNPGSSYTTSMPLAVALGVISMGMTCDEAVWAATAGGARALRRDDVGVLRPGSRADFVVLDAASHVHLAYRPGVNLVAAVARGGVWAAGSLAA